MALGKNLKKEQLISDKKKSKKATKKKKVAKKNLIPEKKSNPKTFDAKQFVSNYITESQEKHRNKIREQYRREIAELAGRILQFVVFKVGDESYAIDISRVKEVVPIPKLAEAPDTPAHVKGIATIRDNDYMAYDLHLKFQKDGESNPTFAMVVGRTEQSKICFLLEGIPTTLKIEGEKVTSDLSMLDNATRNTTYIKGLIHHEEDLIFYLDINELVSSDKAIVIPDEMISQ